MGKLYTTYIANIKNIPPGTMSFIITRWAPPALKYTDILKKCTSLAPSEALLSYYKRKMITWEEFEQKFEQEMSREPMREAIGFIANRLTKQDICIVCYEKTNDQCHRRLIAQAIHKMYGYEWEELSCVKEK